MDGGAYSLDQIGAAMILVGFPRDPQVIANGMATVRPESGGRRVDNKICCWGPWQLNRDNGGDSADESCAADLICSTRVAKGLWESAGNCFACQPGPNPWQAGTDNAGPSDVARAKRLLGKSQSELIGIANVSVAGKDALGAAGDAVNGIADVALSIPNAIKALVDLLRALFQALFSPQFWLRVGKALLGAIAVIAGALILARAMLGTGLGVGERVGKARRERVAARQYERETRRQEGRAARTQAAREREKARGEKARATRWWDDMNKRNADNDIPF